MAEAPPAQRLLAVFTAAKLEFSSADQAWAEAVQLSPLLGYVVALFPHSPASFELCVAWLKLGAQRLELDLAPVNRLADAREASKAGRNRAAFELGSLRNEAVLAGRPAQAAFADAAAHLAEVWADPADEENDAFARAAAASQALITATVCAEGKTDDAAARAVARKRWLGWRRECSPHPP